MLTVAFGPRPHMHGRKRGDCQLHAFIVRTPSVFLLLFLNHSVSMQIARIGGSVRVKYLYIRVHLNLLLKMPSAVIYNSECTILCIC